MRKKLLVYVLISFLTVFKLTAQTVNKIIGIVKANGKEINAATVALFRLPDSTLIKTEITNAKGNYEFNRIKNGNYFITASFTGYQKKSTVAFSLIKEADDFTAPVILLNIASKNMDAV